MPRTTPEVMPDTYFDLIRAFPLTSIRDADHLRAAQRVVDGLLTRDLDDGGEAYMDALCDLVEVFETAHEPAVDVSPRELLKELMDANRLTQRGLSEAVGIAQSTISAVMAGRRSLTIEHARKLGERFKVSPSVFLPV